MRALVVVLLLIVAGACGGKRYAPGRVEYRSWTSSPTINRQTGACTYTVFALATRNAPHRLRVHGVELPGVDWSWSWEMLPIPANVHASGLLIEFLDPGSREVKATHELAVTCGGR